MTVKETEQVSSAVHVRAVLVSKAQPEPWPSPSCQSVSKAAPSASTQQMN